MIRRPAPVAAVAIALGGLGVTAPQPADAQERLLLAGGELAETAYYGYVGTIVPFGAREQGRGWFQRYWLDAYGYEYLGGPGRVQADAYGLEAALGYGGSDEGGWWSASLGLRYTDTSLEPDDPSAEARGGQFGGKVQLEAERRVVGRWRLGGIASYTSEQDSYWARARLMRTGAGGNANGIEAVAGGNDEADSVAVGFVTILRRDPRSPWTVALKAGYRFQDDADGAYAGVELGYGF